MKTVCGKVWVYAIAIVCAAAFAISERTSLHASAIADASSKVIAAAQSNQPAPRINFAQLPLSFEPNLGQADPRVKFLSRGPGYMLFLTPTEAVLALRSGNSPLPVGERREKTRARGKNTVLRLNLIGASPNAQVEGADRLPGIANYFIGSDPRKWRTDIPTYAKVRYRNVYPGIDLVYYGTNQRQLEYDFILAPGANPKAIAIRFDGAKKLSLNSNGGVIAKLPDGVEVLHRAPAIYQERCRPERGDGKRKKKCHPERVAGRCVLQGKNTIGFELAGYDRTRAVYIDPALVYSTYLGGSGSDEGNGIAVDSSGNAYVTGITASTNFPTTGGAFQTVNNAAAFGNVNAFVTKLNATGTALDYSTYLGGTTGYYDDTYGDRATGIAVDSSGDAYVTGATSSIANASCTASGTPEPCCSGAGTGTCIGFPTTAGAFQTVNNAAANLGTNAFVTKLNATGTALDYSTYLGGSISEPESYSIGDYGAGIVVDASGNAYVTGYARSITNASCTASGTPESCCTGAGTGTCIGFPTTAGAFQTVNNAAAIAGVNAFVTKLNATGTALDYSTYLGGGGYDQGAGIAVDSDGNAYVTGPAESITNAGCTFPDYPASCCTGAGTGTCIGFPTTVGAFQTVNNAAGSANPFVTKLNATGTALGYSTYLGGSNYDYATGIAVDSDGDAYVTGQAFSITSASCTASGTPEPCCTGAGTGTCIGFPTTAGAFQTVNNAAAIDGANAFATKLNATGAALDYSTYLGGNGDIGYIFSPESYDAGAIAVDSDGDAYVTGLAYSITNASCTGSGTPGWAPCCTGAGTGTCIGFPTTAGAFQTVNNAAANYEFNAFVTKLNATGTALDYSTYLGGSGNNVSGVGDYGAGIAVDSHGEAYVTGVASSITNDSCTASGTPESCCTGAGTGTCDFPITAGAFQTVNKGKIHGANAFVAKLALGTGSPSPTLTATATATPTATTSSTATSTATATSTPTATPTPGVGTLTFKPDSLNFGDKTLVGKTSKAKSVTIKNDSPKKSKLDVSITGETTAAPFAVKSQCSKTLAPGKSCKVSVTFSPTDTTAQTGSLTINDDAAGAPQETSLSGTGKRRR